MKILHKLTRFNFLFNYKVMIDIIWHNRIFKYNTVVSNFFGIAETKRCVASVTFLDVCETVFKKPLHYFNFLTDPIGDLAKNDRKRRFPPFDFLSSYQDPQYLFAVPVGYVKPFMGNLKSLSHAY